jgi:hypothetical protein
MFEFNYQSWFDNFLGSIKVSTNFRKFELIWFDLNKSLEKWKKANVALGQIWPPQLELVAHWQNRGRWLHGAWPAAPAKIRWGSGLGHYGATVTRFEASRRTKLTGSGCSMVVHLGWWSLTVTDRRSDEGRRWWCRRGALRGLGACGGQVGAVS